MEFLVYNPCTLCYDWYFFVNTCWSLGEPGNEGSLQFGSTQRPKARGWLIFHEYAAGKEQEVPMAMAAWRYLLK